MLILIFLIFLIVILIIREILGADASLGNGGDVRVMIGDGNGDNNDDDFGDVDNDDDGGGWMMQVMFAGVPGNQQFLLFTHKPEVRLPKIFTDN